MNRPILAEIAPGELIDKITILQIKSERIADTDKLRNVQVELDVLAATRDAAMATPDESSKSPDESSESADESSELTAQLNELTAQLKQVNEALWEIEDKIRECERGGDFGPRFIELARSVYHRNDERAALKRAINELLGSKLVEEKSYAAY
jgi:hypothetical protein